MACSNKSEDQALEDTSASVENNFSMEALSDNARIELGNLVKDTIENRIACQGKVTVPAYRRAAVHSRSRGQVWLKGFVPGDYIRKGQLMATITNPEFLTMQRDFLNYKTNMDYAERSLERNRKMQKDNAVSQRAFDESQKQFEIERNGYLSMKKELGILGFDTDKIESESGFQSEIGLYAPFSGQLASVNVVSGSFVEPNNTIAELYAVDGLVLELRVASHEGFAVEKGMKVFYEALGRSKTYETVVHSIRAPVSEDDSFIALYCKLGEQKGLKPGMHINAELVIGQDVLELLPISGTVKSGEDYYGYKVKDDSLVQVRLQSARVLDGFVDFANAKEGKWVIKGAYYIE